MRFFVRSLALLHAVLILGLSTGAAVPANMLLLGAARSDAGIVAVGERGTILTSSDHGNSWAAANTPTSTTLTAVTFQADGRTGWAVGHDALIITTTDGGRTWNQAWQGENLEDSFLDVLASGDSTIIAVGAYGFAMRSDDAGKSWQRAEIQDDDSHLNRITQDARGRLYLAGERGTLLSSDDQGRSWSVIPAPYDGSFYGILPLKSGALLAYGLRGHVYRSEDDGENWTNISTASTSLIACSIETQSGTIFLAGQARTLLQSADDGSVFAAPPDVPALATAFLLETQSSRILAFGEGGARFLTLPSHE